MGRNRGRHCERSEAIQLSDVPTVWIASSAMPPRNDAVWVGVSRLSPPRKPRRALLDEMRDALLEILALEALAHFLVRDLDGIAEA